jgi:predicted nucleic acid-binding protein
MSVVTAIDSSALLRHCFGEGDIRLVEEALLGAVAVSALAAVEVPCAIYARFHRGLLDGRQRDEFLGSAERLLLAAAQMGVTLPIQREAVRVGARFLVRAMDAIHVATAVVIARQQRRQGNTVRFCTADHRRAAAATALLGAANVDVLPPLPPT